jgi:osmoprotectant transport system permease protein
LLAALQPLIGKIPVGAMQAANYSVDRDREKASPAEAAKALDRQILPSP